MGCISRARVRHGTEKTCPPMCVYPRWTGTTDAWALEVSFTVAGGGSPSRSAAAGTRTWAPRDRRLPSHCRELTAAVQAVLGARSRVSVSVGLGKADLYHLLCPLKEYRLCKSPSREPADERWAGRGTPSWSRSCRWWSFQLGDYDWTCRIRKMWLIVFSCFRRFNL